MSKLFNAVSTNDLDGLKLKFDGCWAITAHRWDVSACFAGLDQLAGESATLYLEGGVHSQEISKFIRVHSIPADQPIARGTVWPRQQVHHLPASSAVFDALSQLADHHASPEICEHLVIYRDSLVLVDWYDAFDREVYASSQIPEHLVEAFADFVGGSYRIETS